MQEREGEQGEGEERTYTEGKGEKGGEGKISRRRARGTDRVTNREQRVGLQTEKDAEENIERTQKRHNKNRKPEINKSKRRKRME